MAISQPFRQVWAADFEFIAADGERPVPVCMVAREILTGATVRLWQDELRRRDRPPFPVGPDSLFVAFYASAELGCFLELGWPVPERVLDLYAEFRRHTAGTRVPCGYGLLGALAAFGLESISVAEKDTMRALVLRGGPWTDSERQAVLEYCETDVVALERLLPAMLPVIDLPRALLRGRYMVAVARMERTGVPVDADLHARLVTHWSEIRERLVGEIDQDYHVYEGRTFKRDRFAAWLSAHEIPWPLLENGAQLDLKDDTFRQMAKAHPEIAPLHELRASLSQLRLNELAVGRDGRARTLLSPFGARSGRNTPSSTRFVFGPSVWLRGLIRPPPGRAIAYIDWSQQEFAIAAALSGDANMLEAYRSGDPYLSFAQRAGAVPLEATKATHGAQRELYKVCSLAVQYGMEAPSLAARIGKTEIVARHLLRDHREVFHDFWRWSDSAAAHWSLCGELLTVFGWRLRNDDGKSERTARNFPMQANGAEMMRIAACLMTEAGIEVCCPVHDAFLIEAADADILEVVRVAQAHMAAASRAVLATLELRSDAKVIRFPDRYSDPRGARMWLTVMRLLPTGMPHDTSSKDLMGACGTESATANQHDETISEHLHDSI